MAAGVDQGLKRMLTTMANQAILIERAEILAYLEQQRDWADAMEMPTLRDFVQKFILDIQAGVHELEDA